MLYREAALTLMETLTRNKMLYGSRGVSVGGLTWEQISLYFPFISK